MCRPHRRRQTLVLLGALALVATGCAGNSGHDAPDGAASSSAAAAYVPTTPATSPTGDTTAPATPSAPKKTTAGSSTAAAGPAVTVASCGPDETAVIAAVWARALDNNGFTVTDAGVMNNREECLAKLAAGEISLIPDYSSSLARYLSRTHGDEPLPDGATGKQAMGTLKKNLPAGLALGKQLPAPVAPVFAVTKQFARAHHLETLADLRKLDSFLLAVNACTADDNIDIDAVAAHYGIDPGAVTVVAGSECNPTGPVQMISEGKADVAEIFTTTPPLDDAGRPVDLVYLKDPDKQIPTEGIVPVMYGKAINGDARGLLATLNKFLDTDTLVELNTATVGEQAVPLDDIAVAFIAHHPVGTGR
ncbi:glycine betaine ABC transporter substrate-binding protein [Corynebacterium mendelii]|uniref:ABC-type glycine betaine transport system substrate-binding domain-containing protein n=1 Tax=Corynebacterium mendelii TaxID=2765362 RepID=A0A939IY67_9CORY|nr:glycine betaine ABC transporter substrate-binding protein [Corynebacterium mendelii]MBN9645215.1 hypothetical protein [Corynebacterium mendelii]